MVRIVSLAHTIEAMAMSVTTDRRGRRHLKPLADFLKPRPSLDDGAKVAAYLDRKIAKQER